MHLLLPNLALPMSEVILAGRAAVVGAAQVHALVQRPDVVNALVVLAVGAPEIRIGGVVRRPAGRLGVAAVRREGTVVVDDDYAGVLGRGRHGHGRIVKIGKASTTYASSIGDRGRGDVLVLGFIRRGRRGEDERGR